ncbi:YxeA family protein [Bacillus haynesii]|uniref:YxeA family protein n=1 Tax=Bacillus haynesii TaxID=1925021 RepID=UPI00227E5B9D|nr:YxeA family protein [Bacillus haynesii]
MKKIAFFVLILSCMPVFLLTACNQKNVKLESDYYVQIHDQAEKAPNKQYVYNLEGYNKDGKKKVVSFFVDKPYPKGTLVRVPRSYDGYTGMPAVMKTDELPDKIKDQFLIFIKVGGQHPIHQVLIRIIGRAI